MHDPTMQRLVRRETHSPRSAVAVVALALTVIAATYAAVELMLRLAGAAPLWVTPRAAVIWFAELPAAGTPVAALGIGVGLTIAAIIMLWCAISPGRRARHEMLGASSGIVVDNEVIASALAEQLRRELDLAPGQVRVGISHRTADVAVHPTAGHTIETGEVRDLSAAVLAGYDLSPPLRVKARVVIATDTKEAR